MRGSRVTCFHKPPALAAMDGSADSPSDSQRSERTGDDVAYLGVGERDRIGLHTACLLGGCHEGGDLGWIEPVVSQPWDGQRGGQLVQPANRVLGAGLRVTGQQVGKVGELAKRWMLGGSVA